jgi:hypothetical protein
MSAEGMESWRFGERKRPAMRSHRLSIAILAGVLFAVSSTYIAAPVLAAPQTNGDQIVYITRSGKKYHAEGCRFLRKSKTPVKLKDAVKSGYTPCSVCKPPKLDKDGGSKPAADSVKYLSQ